MPYRELIVASAPAQIAAPRQAASFLDLLVTLEATPKKFLKLTCDVIEMIYAKTWIRTNPKRLIHHYIGIG